MFNNMFRSHPHIVRVLSRGTSRIPYTGRSRLDTRLVPQSNDLVLFAPIKLPSVIPHETALTSDARVGKSRQTNWCYRRRTEPGSGYHHRRWSPNPRTTNVSDRSDVALNDKQRGKLKPWLSVPGLAPIGALIRIVQSSPLETVGGR